MHASIDQEAFARAYDTHVERIYRYHFYRTRVREVAEDLTSQTFLKALEHFASFQPKKASLTTWLYAIARNCLIDHYRTAKPTAPLEHAEEIPSDASPERTAATTLSMEHVGRLLGTLSDEQREIVLLRLWDDMPYAEIARIIGKNEGACKMTFRRAVDHLRAQAGPAALLLILSIPSLFPRP